ncbi:MAG: CotH kinase family protein [Verrucomicrobiales bacterium]
MNQPPQFVGEHSGATTPEAELLLRIRDLRRKPEFGPGGVRYHELTATYLPLVLGLAEKMSGMASTKHLMANAAGDPVEETNGGATAESLPPPLQYAVEAVFDLFAKKWKRISRKTLLATWFWRTTYYVVVAQLAKDGSQAQIPPSRRGFQLLACKLLKLPTKRQEAILLLKIQQLDPASVSRVLKIKEKRLIKAATIGETNLLRALRKKKLDPSHFSLSAIAGEGNVPLAISIAESSRTASAGEERQSLTRAAVSAWRKFHFFRFVSSISRALGITVLAMASAFGLFYFLATHGYLNEFFMEQRDKNFRAAFPELIQPAQPWPAATNNTVGRFPQNAAELYNPSNIWQVSLHFTSENWKAIAPSNIPPVRNMFQNGRIVLRNPNAKRSGLSGVAGYEFNYTEGNLHFGSNRFEKVGVRYRGNGTFLNSRFGPKQSFKVDMNEYVKGQKMAGLKTLNFLNCIADDTYMRDILAQRFFADIGAIGPRASYAYLTIEVPEDFGTKPLGLYVVMENIDADFAEDRFGHKRVPIFKPVTYELFQDLGPDWSAYAPIYDLKTKATSDQTERVVAFSKLVTHASDEDFAKKLPEFLDLEEFAAFLAGHVILSSYDGFLANGQNYYIYLHPESNRFGFIPWDQDHSWGEFGYTGTPEMRERASIWKPSSYENRFLDRVMAVEEFQVLYRKKIEYALQHYFIKERLFAQVDELTEQIRPAVEAENPFRLRRFDEAVSSTWKEGPRQNEHREGPESLVQPIKRFIENRIDSLRKQLDGKEDGVQLRRDR